MLEKIKRSKAAVSTMVLAVVAILVIIVVSAGMYVSLLSDEDNGNDGNGGNNGNNGNNGNGENWSGLDFSDPRIQGTLGIGTEYTYSYSVEDEPAGELTMTIIGQSGSYYAYEITGVSEISDRHGMIHKQTGQLRFSESDGTDGEHDGEPLTKWKLNIGEAIGTDKIGNEDVVRKADTHIVFSSNSKSILPFKFYIHYKEEIDGNITYSYVYKAELTDKNPKTPTEYEMSKHIGNRSWISMICKEDNKTIGNGNQYRRIIGDIGSDRYMCVTILETEKTNDKKLEKVRFLTYTIFNEFLSSYDDYTKGDDVTIDTKWGNKNCEYYYLEDSQSDCSYKNEIYVGKVDKIPYLTKMIYKYPDYTESTEYVLEEYVIS